MKTEELYTMIQQKPVILDGATGSNLQKVGMKPGVCPEEWILENEDKLIDLQKSFVEAGTNILYAPTFSGNRVKLEEYGLADRAEEINKRLVGLSKRAAGDKALVAGDMTMTGVALEPVGPMKLEALINIYKEQAKYLLEAGVDLFVVETMMSLAETRAAVIAIKEVCNLPVIASLTFQEDGRTLYGTDPVTAVVVLQSIGADIIGVNCRLLLKQVQDSSADAVALPQNIFECLLKKFRVSQQKLHATYIQLCLLQRERVRKSLLMESSLLLVRESIQLERKNCRKNFVPENSTL